jgi:ribosomal protein L7/L12
MQTREGRSEFANFMVHIAGDHEERHLGRLVVSYSVVAMVALVAFVLGVLTARRRPDTKVIWEAPRSGPEHEAAIADPELRTLLEQKQLIAAIRRYRDLTGSGLKESKDAVEALQRSLPGA